MSLVEKVLKKVQESQTSGTPPAGASLDPVSSALAMGRGVDTAAATRNQRTPFVARNPRTVEIDVAQLRAAGFLPPQHQERQLADQYRQIKRPLLANAFGRGAPRVPNGHAILMASAIPGEGKTFTTINLGLSISLEKEVSVVVVDCDAAKPHISRIFGISGEPGLFDALSDETIDVRSLILPTSVQGLYLLPAGRHQETSTELLASARMEEVLKDIASYDRNTIVLFDSSPLLLTSESRVLAGVVGQIVLVVRAGSTPQRAVLEAVEHLGEGRHIGVVLNQSDEAGPGSYNYRYGVYPREADIAPAEKRT